MEELDELSKTIEEGFAAVHRRIDTLFYVQILSWIVLLAAVIAHAV